MIRDKALLIFCLPLSSRSSVYLKKSRTSPIEEYFRDQCGVPRVSDGKRLGSFHFWPPTWTTSPLDSST
ncbi:hypothetical protein CASFOL_030705 [Castilleja foliolosa]|uniref:Secreted protein n=1 Tax=Castilleja foliolosa TaxID=1961234 RepID=A0ABD3C635_9LAMI